MKNRAIGLSVAVAFALSLQGYAVANPNDLGANPNANQSANPRTNPNADSNKSATNPNTQSTDSTDSPQTPRNPNPNLRFRANRARGKIRRR